MPDATALALQEFTARWCQQWQHLYQHAPFSEALLGIPSPCVTETRDNGVFWLPQPFVPARDLSKVERALDITLQPAIHAFFTTQFAGEMAASFKEVPLVLSQVWSEEDFVQTQENLIGHLVMKRRLKHSPTLFIATTDKELEIISLCNLTGEVIKEEIGTRRRQVLSESVNIFLNELQPLKL